MRGLTDEERGLLTQLAAPGTAVAEFTELHDELVDRDVARYAILSDEDGPYELCEATDLGELALRADAAARARGLWPPK